MKKVFFPAGRLSQGRMDRNPLQWKRRLTLLSKVFFVTKALASGAGLARLLICRRFFGLCLREKFILKK